MKLELKTSTGSKTQLKIELIFITLKQQMILPGGILMFIFIYLIIITVTVLFSLY